jgi:hypothetical protein
MKAIHWIIAAAAFATIQPSQAAMTDPEVILYRFPGVRDSGGAAGTGVATVFHCTNFSGVAETLRFVTRFSTGNLASNVPTSIVHLATKTAATHNTVAYDEDVILATGTVGQGTTAIAATSIHIICTAETIDASTAVPIGVARRGIRFSPVPGSQE